MGLSNSYTFTNPTDLKSGAFDSWTWLSHCGNHLAIHQSIRADLEDTCSELSNQRVVRRPQKQSIVLGTHPDNLPYGEQHTLIDNITQKRDDVVRDFCATTLPAVSLEYTCKHVWIS